MSSNTTNNNGPSSYCNEDSDCLNRTICVGNAFWHSSTLNKGSISVCECAGTYGWEKDDATGMCNKFGLGYMLQIVVMMILMLWNAVILVVIIENIYVLIRYTTLKIYGDTGITALYAMAAMATSLGALALDFDDSSSPFRFTYISIDGTKMKAGVNYYRVEILESVSITLLYLALFNIQKSWIERSQKINKTLVLKDYPWLRRYGHILIAAQAAFVISIIYFIASVHTYLIGFIVVPFSLLLIGLFQIGGNMLATLLKNFAASLTNDPGRQLETIEVANRVLKVARSFIISLVVVVLAYIAVGIYGLSVQVPRADAAPPGGFNRPVTWISLIISLYFLNCLSTIVRYLHPSIRASQEKYLATHKSTLSNVGSPKNNP